MKRDLSIWQFWGFAFTVLFGTLLHFLYDWTGESLLIAPFSGVNESTWEHMKLLYFPMLTAALVELRLFKSSESLPAVKLTGILTGLLLIPVLFYTYNGAIGKSPDWLNISIFFISAAAAFRLETYLLKECRVPAGRPKFIIALILFIGLLFVVFTFAPPRLPLFRDPLTGSYGRNPGA